MKDIRLDCLIMNNRIDYNRNEFFGEIAKYCIEENYIWFYDEISGGLYRLDRINYFVELILSPMEIHQKEIFPIRQILKWKNEVYLIPDDISHEWLVYDFIDKRLRKVLLLSQSYKIGNAVSIGKWIYLIPEKTNQVLAIVEAGTLHLKSIIDNWYKNNAKIYDCWGYSVLDDNIYFPIIGTKELFQIQGEMITEYSIHIEQLVYSISLCKNGIWILPCEGKSIFFIDRNSGLIDFVTIKTELYENTTEQFARIIAEDKYVYLLPKHGGEIWVLKISEKKWIVVGEKNARFYRSLYQKERNMPYWGCYYSEGKLYTLPLQYRFAEINVENQSVSYKVLKYAIALMEQQYMSWINWFGKKTKNNFVEWERNSLNDFWKVVSKYNISNTEKFIGKNIWVMINKL